MEFADVTVKESPGLCRCCLSEGCYKDLGTEYAWMNDTEVYADMLLDCFDIGITQHNDGPNGPKRLICEVCITRLRDACNFKKQVVDSEKKFIDMLGRGEFRHMEKQTVMLPIYTSVAPMKAETIEEVTVNEDYDDSHVEFVDDNDFTEDEELVKTEASNPVPVASTSAAKRGRPKKTESDVPEKKPKLKGKSKMPKGGKPEASSKSSKFGRRQNIKANIAAILQNTTVVPFRWHKQFFMCFYCHLPIQTFKKLKDHMNLQHRCPNVPPVVALLKKDEKVKVDVTTISCKICKHEPKDFNAMIEHLKSHYKLKIKADIGVIPFKLTEGYKCAVCNETFQYFVKLNQHMNKHFGNYICEICGKSFLSGDRLRSHALLHTANFSCTLCPETFDTNIKRANHTAKVHDKEQSFKCYFCADLFPTKTRRVEHLKATHGIDMPVYDCPVCKKNFRNASRMQFHLNSVHSRVKET